MKLKDAENGTIFVFSEDIVSLKSACPVYRVESDCYKFKINTLHAGFYSTIIQADNALMDAEIILVDIPWRKILSDTLEKL